MSVRNTRSVHVDILLWKHPLCFPSVFLLVLCIFLLLSYNNYYSVTMGHGADNRWTPAAALSSSDRDWILRGDCKGEDYLTSDIKVLLAKWQDISEFVEKKSSWKSSYKSYCCRKKQTSLDRFLLKRNNNNSPPSSSSHTNHPIFKVINLIKPDYISFAFSLKKINFFGGVMLGL